MIRALRNILFSLSALLVCWIVVLAYAIYDRFNSKMIKKTLWQWLCWNWGVFWRSYEDGLK